MFRVGDRLICIDDIDSPGNSLTKNVIYTISRVNEEIDGSYYIGLREVSSFSFCSNRFVSVVKYRREKLNKLKAKINNYERFNQN